MPNWHLGAGRLAQTVWSVVHGFDPSFGIKDYDLVYYDSSDISYTSEGVYAEKARALCGDLRAAVEVKNEAMVYLWYPEHFGYSIALYQSVEHAINTWPRTATSVAISTGTDGALKVYAPFGLNDLQGMIVRPNKTQSLLSDYWLSPQRTFEADQTQRALTFTGRSDIRNSACRAFLTILSSRRAHYGGTRNNGMESAPRQDTGFSRERSVRQENP